MKESGSQLTEQLDKISGPSDGDCGGCSQIFEHKVPADEPGEKPAEGRVGVSVGRACHGNHGRELGVAEAREQAAKTGDNKRDDDAGACIGGCGMAGDHEDARADDGADAERYELPGPERAMQFMGFRSCDFAFNRHAISLQIIELLSHGFSLPPTGPYYLGLSS